ncbi:hypothetical protein LG634_24730 [Streptomyces bambusae]|uniref:hypothetical protein n=1 Tax=Streptomyces bambusae TaxID=1550616 RepID=UPI001CFD64D3|nr:hypothetical protein [Streptomyces bambusae]MCB5168019.1 hypothetical protein [Streptomyces bambusae]
MHERTYASQPDEHLRRATHHEQTADTTSTLLLVAAGILTASRPQDRMVDIVRRYYAQRLGTEHGGIDSALAETTTAALLDAMPRPYADETRGEYALRLRKTAEAVR